MDKQQVLIIDDDKDTANLLDLVFSLLGFQCQSVYTLEDALVALQNTCPDMIMLDLKLGQASGGEQVLYRVRGDSRFDATRVIVITAYPVMAKPISDLADLVLVKPVEVEQLKQLTSRLLEVEIRPRQYFYRDPTTELFNREFFQTRLEHAFERYRRRKGFCYAVLMLEIKVRGADPREQKTVVLRPVYKEVAERLRRSFRPTDTIAYIESGRFAILHEELRGVEDVSILVDRVRAVLSPPIMVGPNRYEIELHIGAALNDVIYSTPGDILTAAAESLD
jgi:PleD family two-component response regulator